MNLREHKRTIYLITGGLFLGVFGFLAYQYFLPDVIVRPGQAPDTRVSGGVAPAPPSQGFQPEEPTEPAPSEPTPGAQEQKLTQITTFPVVGPRLNKEQNQIWFYKKDGGDLFSSDFAGQNQEKISNITIVGLFDGEASPAGDRTALFYLDGETKKTFLHIGTSTTAALPENITSFSWNPQGASLAYLIREGATRANLSVANGEGRASQTIFSTPLSDAKIQWISSSRIAFQTAASGLAEGFVFLYDRGRGSFDRVLGPLFGLLTRWSPDGERVLASATDPGGRNLSLAVRNALGTVAFTPPFQTFADKCAWASARVFYCAAPKFISASLLLPDEYLRGEFISFDRLFRVDLSENSVQEIPVEASLDIVDLVITKNEGHLFFVNRLDGTLWSLKLK